MIFITFGHCGEFDIYFKNTQLLFPPPEMFRQYDNMFPLTSLRHLFIPHLE